MAGILNLQHREASFLENHSGLEGRIIEHDGFLYAPRLELFGYRVAIGDVVCHGEMAAIVDACICDPQEGELYILASILDYVRQLSPQTSLWQHPANPVQEVWRAEHTTQAIAWHIAGNKISLVRV